MAVHANSTPVPARPLLGPEALPSGGLLPARRAELLAILEDAPTARIWGLITRPQRRAIQAGVDALVDYLDALDDADLEDGADDELTGDEEETLGWPDRMSQIRLGANTADGDNTAPERHGCGFLPCSADDVEITCEDEGACILSQRHDQEHDEPSLGSPEVHHDQRRWGQGRYSREMDHDERAGLRSWGTYNETRQRVEQCRRDTEAMLRRKRLIRVDMDELRIVYPGIAEFRGMRL